MRLLGAIVAFAIVCMLTVAVVTDRLADSFMSRGGAAPSSRVHLIHEVVLALEKAENFRASYLATGSGVCLEGYQAACLDVDTRMDRLVSDDHAVSSKIIRAEDLRDFVHTKLSEIGKSLSKNPATGKPVPVPGLDGELVRIQRLLGSLAQEETRDITGELETARARSAFHRNLVVALGVINFLFLAGVTFCALQIGKIYSLVTMCAWSKRVQYGDKWIPLEEYMHKRFGVRISHGISQEEFEKWAPPEAAHETPLPVSPPTTPKAA